MELRKTTRITVQTDQVLTIRRERLIRAWCTDCQGETDFVPLEAVNRLLKGRACLTAVPGETGGVHSAKAKDGSTLICLRSLLESGRL